MTKAKDIILIVICALLSASGLGVVGVSTAYMVVSSEKIAIVDIRVSEEKSPIETYL